MNSIAIYVLYQLSHSPVRAWTHIHLDWLPMFKKDNPYMPQWEGTVFVLVLWLICLWMCKRKIFIRV